MNNKELLLKLTTYYSDKANDIIASYQASKKTTLRVNTLKSTTTEISKILDENNITYHKVPWSTDALIIDNQSSNALSELSIYQEGKIYLQSLSSQLPPLILNPKEHDLILDMAASPGGKTTEMAALTNNKAMITAIEMNKIRCERLKYNIEHQGAKKVTVLNINAKQLDDYFMFDKILLDAPCSGSGTIQKDTKEFSLAYLNKITNTQKTLLDIAINHLKVNGELVYSTCSILKEENEDIVKSILNKYSNIEIVPIDIKEYPDIPLLPSDIPGTITICPTIYYEGFFVAKLKKTS